jgi:hypothetical protein
MSDITVHIELFHGYQELLIDDYVFLSNWDEIRKSYRGPSIDASYQVSIHLAKGPTI